MEMLPIHPEKLDKVTASCWKEGEGEKQHKGRMMGGGGRGKGGREGRGREGGEREGGKGEGGGREGGKGEGKERGGRGERGESKEMDMEMERTKETRRRREVQIGPHINQTSIGCSVPPISIVAELKKLGMEMMLVILLDVSSETKNVSEDEVSVSSI